MKKKEHLEIIKNGKFYNCYGEDALIINYLLNYKIVSNGKVGFPDSGYNKVINALEENKISYRLINSDEDIEKDFRKLNNYEKILGVANKYSGLNSRVEELITKIKKMDFKKMEKLIEELENCLK